MRITSLVLASCFTLAACSTAEQAEGSATAGMTLTGGPATSGPAGMTDAASQSGTGEPATSGQATTSTSGPTSSESSPGTDSVTMPGSTGGIEPGTTGTTGTTGPDMTGGTSGTSTGGTSGGTTGGMGGGPCEFDADCKLHDDCCSCYATPVDEDGPSCEMECDQSKCSELGLDQAVCRFGQCAFGKVDCSSEVLCDSLPPNCAPGRLPSVENGCWTGNCVPAEACDKVPDCKLCPDSMMCVEFQAWMIDRTCEPIPAKCDGDPTCDCAGGLACVEPYGTCNEGVGDSDLICVCIAC